MAFLDYLKLLIEPLDRCLFKNQCNRVDVLLIIVVTIVLSLLYLRRRLTSHSKLRELLDNDALGRWGRNRLQREAERARKEFSKRIQLSQERSQNTSSLQWPQKFPCIVLHPPSVSHLEALCPTKTDSPNAHGYIELNPPSGEEIISDTQTLFSELKKTN